MNTNNRFFCISFFDGSLDLLKYTNDKFFVYFKGEKNLDLYHSFSDSRKAWIPNSGFNLRAYLLFIINRYYNLPDIVVFCKNNVYPRHVSEKTFVRLSKRNIYTPIVEQSSWSSMRFPIAVFSNVGDFLELNNSWYARRKKGRYFSTFNHFFRFLFPDSPIPTYLRFGPGANVVVPRSHILLRSKAFYENLLLFIDYEEHALESYFIERSLDAIFNSPFDENILMTKPLSTETLKNLELKANFSVNNFNIVSHILSRIYFAGVFLGNKFFGVSRE
jgi:hypothetical protein